jgi:hypothetical protein
VRSQVQLLTFSLEQRARVVVRLQCMVKVRQTHQPGACCKPASSLMRKVIHPELGTQ